MTHHIENRLPVGRLSAGLFDVHSLYLEALVKKSFARRLNKLGMKGTTFVALCSDYRRLMLVELEGQSGKFWCSSPHLFNTSVLSRSWLPGASFQCLLEYCAAGEIEYRSIGDNRTR